MAHDGVRDGTTTTTTTEMNDDGYTDDYEYHGFWAQNPLLNGPSTCTSPLLDSNPNMGQNSLLHQNHMGTNQTGMSYIPFEVPSPLINHATTYRIFMHGSSISQSSTSQKINP